MSESPKVRLIINGRPVVADEGSMVSAAMLNAGITQRISAAGEPRAALCGMGICFECRAVVDGVMHRRTCQLVCRDGMTVETQS
jgi:sarcosine oxidase subunit alpha